MKYYKYNNDFFSSKDDYDLEIVDASAIRDFDNIYYLAHLGKKARFIFETCSLENYREDISILFKKGNKEDKCFKVINTSYPNWKDDYKRSTPKKWRVNILALGDVGSTLLSGLKLLGSEVISEIGIFDLDPNTLKRFEMEYNQVFDPFSEQVMPEVKIIDIKNIFDCDLFIFCASKAIPEVGSGIGDVRMAQFTANKQIIEYYSSMARENNYKGIFAVVSDPVDLLSRTAFESSNCVNGEFDFLGLKPEQVIGYGLGVMNARAVYYAKQKGYQDFLTNGRAYGPHGKNLVIINDIDNYNLAKSKELTELAINANKVIRSFGFKPFIAPALSSATLSIINTIKGNYNYSSTFIGGTYYGAKNKLINNQIKIDKINFDQGIYDTIETSYRRVGDLY